MAEKPTQRRLAAILAADVVGYSRLMEQDEAGTLALLKSRRRDVLEPLVIQHQGRVFKSIGDGVLIEFGSAVNAVQCAVDLQERMAAANSGQPDECQIVLRIGVNLGDVMVEGGDLFGDGINIAARLEGLAQPGGILISGTAYDYVRNKVKVAFEDLGAQTVKNISEPVRTYRVQIGAGLATMRPSLALPDRPSIAVLPFQNMSGDPEQEYFADGIVEEIITALSRFKSLFVIARNSSFTYKGRAVDVKQVGRELGVRYVLEGSVRKAGNRVRITGQLIDAAMGTHLWADRFEGDLADIFDLQDRVATSVVGAIAPKLEQAEIERAKRKPTGSLDAYDYYLRGMAAFYRLTKQATDEALRLFYRAIELDPGFASAYGMAARCYGWRKSNGWLTAPDQDVAETVRLARHAAELGKDDASALCYAGWAFALVVGDPDTGAAFINQAIQLNPNMAIGFLASGWTLIFLGDHEAATKHFLNAMRLSPSDPLIHRMQSGVATAALLAGRYDEASSWATKALRGQPNLLNALRASAASNALSGRLDEAKEAVGLLNKLDPTFRVSNLVERAPLCRSEDLIRFSDGLRKAGLPE